MKELFILTMRIVVVRELLRNSLRRGESQLYENFLTDLDLDFDLETLRELLC